MLLVLSCCRFKFPSVFVIFQTITVSVCTVFILIALIDKEEFLCSSDDLVENIDNPTPFCIIIGRNVMLWHNILWTPLYQAIFLVTRFSLTWLDSPTKICFLIATKLLITLCMNYPVSTLLCRCYPTLPCTAISTVGCFPCGSCVLGCGVSIPQEEAWCCRQDKVHLFHNDTAGADPALYASCSHFWNWRICCRTWRKLPMHWERQESYFVLFWHCSDCTNCHWNFPSHNCVQKDNQGRVLL